MTTVETKIKEIFPSHSQSQTDQSFFINVGGLTEPQIEELVEYSHADPLIRQFTSDLNRFASREAFVKWRKKRRKIYSLTDENGKLHGIIWIGEKRLPTNYEYLGPIDPKMYPYTIATRVYEKTRGLTLSGQFKLAVIKHFSEQVSHRLIPPLGIWSETSTDNYRNISVNLKIGYRIVTKPNPLNKVLMVI